MTIQNTNIVQLASSLGALAFEKNPPPHKGCSSSYIYPAVAKKVKGIYEGLTAPELAQHCLKTLTQNANEAIHSTIWSHCPKHLFAGRRRVEIATTIAVSTFNSGSTALRELTKGSGVGNITIAHGVKRDSNQVCREAGGDGQDGYCGSTGISISLRGTQLSMGEGGVKYLLSAGIQGPPRPWWGAGQRLIGGSRGYSPLAENHSSQI
ncbi:hypothetical protein PoB_005671000 [Plakobranchus ocellatus]|uniref:Uncharacterized protein n=1 Tax=Plakobranchus ocellatus TaxID=259542 RepID=A0AAV4CBT3_9GAST|nr:hypothetical protein PoB_005671000 [Plakobranchus ocellatus]